MILVALLAGLSIAPVQVKREPTVTFDYRTHSSVKLLSRYIEQCENEERERKLRGRKYGPEATPGLPEKEEVGEEQNEYLRAYKDWLEMRAYPYDTVDWVGFQREALIRERDARLPRGFGGEDMAPIWSYVGPNQMQSSGAMWFGPSPNTGRVSAVAWHPTPGPFATIYAAGASGGVFRGQSGLDAWTALSDDWPFLSVSCIAVHPTNPNILLVGTGDFNGGKPFGGQGVRRSTDGGNTWEPPITTPFGAARCVSQIIFDPEDPRIALACTGRGGEPEFNGAGRIYRSTGTGADGTWVEKNAADDPPAAIWSGMAVSALSPTTGRRFYYASAIDPSGMLWRSHDKGRTWEQLPTPLTNNVYLCVEVTTSPTDPNVVYLMAARQNPAWNPNNPNANPQFIRNIWRSRTAGKPAGSWVSILNNANIDGNTAGTQDQYNWSQAYYDVHMNCSTRKVNGVDTDLLYVGLIDLCASLNPNDNNAANVNFQLIGLTFSNTPKTHNDQHCMAFRPGWPNEALVGQDGGITYMTFDPIANTWHFNPFQSGSLPTTEHYKGSFFAPAATPTVANRMLGGMQDNQHTFIAANGDWKNACPTGDGYGSFIVRVARGMVAAGDIAYGSGYTSIYQGAAADPFNGLKLATVYRTQNNWGANEYVGPFLNSSAGLAVKNPALNEPTRFFVPMGGNPNADEVYIGSNYLYRLLNYNPGSWNGINWTRTGFNAANSQPLTTRELTAIAVAPSDGNIVYTGGFDGRIHRSNNKGAGGSWTRIDNTLPLTRPITHIAVDPTNPNRILVSIGGNTGERRRLWLCNDTTAAAIAWVDLAGPNNANGLRDVVANVCEFDPDLPQTHMYVGTDIGFFYTRTGNQTGNNVIWKDGNTGLGLPKVAVSSIQVLGNGLNANIYVATYGRGFWKVRYGDLP